MNLDLMLDYGAESWKQYNEVLQDMLNRIQVREIVEIHPNQPVGIQQVQITILLGSGSAGRSEESNSGSKLEQKEPTDPGL